MKNTYSTVTGPPRCVGMPLYREDSKVRAHPAISVTEKKTRLTQPGVSTLLHLTHFSHILHTSLTLPPTSSHTQPRSDSKDRWRLHSSPPSYTSLSHLAHLSHFTADLLSHPPCEPRFRPGGSGSLPRRRLLPQVIAARRIAHPCLRRVV